MRYMHLLQPAVFYYLPSRMANSMFIKQKYIYENPYYNNNLIYIKPSTGRVTQNGSSSGVRNDNQASNNDIRPLPRPVSKDNHVL